MDLAFIMLYCLGKTVLQNPFVRYWIPSSLVSSLFMTSSIKYEEWRTERHESYTIKYLFFFQKACDNVQGLNIKKIFKNYLETLILVRYLNIA